MKKKFLALLMSLVLVIGVVASGSLAWLTAKDEPVVNVFTDSNIDITLTETDTDPKKEGEQHDYKMIPGWTIDKDPVVTVLANSEDCWVFIKVEEKGISSTPAYAFSDFIEYKIDPNNWKKLEDDQGNAVPGVYVGVVPSKDITADRAIKVLENQQVKVKDSVTKEMMDIVEQYGEPTLTFTAYATQYWKNNTESFSAYEAWQKTPGYVAPTT